MNTYYQTKRSWPQRKVPKYGYRRPSILGRYRKRIIAILLIVLTYFFIKHVPKPPKTQNNVSANRPPPQRDLDEHAHFLYRSPFREHPDLEYEAELEERLKAVERRVLAGEGEGNTRTIWQIMPTRLDRTSDSMALEAWNSAWTFKVCSLAPRKRKWRRILIYSL